MDDQNNPGGGVPTDQGGGQTPPATGQPAETPVDTVAGDTGSAAPQEEKCVTCGSSASGGTCTACGQGVITCSCTPSGSTQGGSDTAMGGSEPQGAPVM